MIIEKLCPYCFVWLQWRCMECNHKQKFAVWNIDKEKKQADLEDAWEGGPLI